MVMKLNHIAIYAKDMASMNTFYSNVLHFVETERKYHPSGKIKMLRLKINHEQSVELFNFDNEVRNSKQGHINSGYMHLGYSVKCIDETIKDIVQIEQDFVGTDGLRHVFIRDPENNQIELCEDNT